MNLEVDSDCSMDNLSIPSSDYGDQEEKKTEKLAKKKSNSSESHSCDYMEDQQEFIREKGNKISQDVKHNSGYIDSRLINSIRNKDQTADGKIQMKMNNLNIQSKMN